MTFWVRNFDNPLFIKRECAGNPAHSFFCVKGIFFAQSGVITQQSECKTCICGFFFVPLHII